MDELSSSLPPSKRDHFKFDAYRHTVSSGEWVQERSRLPKLLRVVPDIAQERRMHRVAQGRLTPPPEPSVWTTTEVLLKATGPIAPMAAPGRFPAQTPGRRRARWR